MINHHRGKRQTDVYLLWRVFFPAAISVFAGLVAAGCSTETFNSVNDYDAVFSIQDKDYKYSKNSTYAVVDHVEVLSDYLDNGVEIKNKEHWEQIILEAIHKNMKALGYTEETEDIEEADVVVAAGIVTAERWSFYTYYPWWGWYGWYYPPFYGSATVAVDFSSGSVIMVMIDPDRKSTLDVELGTAEDATPDAGADGGDTGLPGDVYQAIWAAGLHGLLNYVSDNKVKAGIDQAFDQSPYLRVGGQR